jgi:hypothetical protein
MNDYVSMVIILLLLNHYILEKGVGNPPPPLKKLIKKVMGLKENGEKSTGTLFPFIAREHTSIRIVHKLMHVGGCLCIC